ncbi:hypothetical protein V1504DRAFT_390715, partial [Lipomyces starkeyi]
RVGDQFPDISAFKHAMKSNAIAEGYQYMTVKQYIVIPANVDEYEVRTMQNECFPVRLDVWTYPCRQWSYRGVPCAHAVAAITFARLDKYDFVDNKFKVEAFEATYRYGIHAMPTVDLNQRDVAVECALSTTSRPPGRPHKRRDTTNEFVTRKTNICGRCHKRMAHNSRTCTEPIVR